MSNIALKKIRSLLLKIIGKKNIEKIIILLTRFGSIDLLRIAYERMGILKWTSSSISGEKYVIERVLKGILKEHIPILLDVGANKGHYAIDLRSAFPDAVIHAFEPNPHTFELLSKNLQGLNIHCHQLGLSSNQSIEKLYSYKDKDKIFSGHASLYRDVLVDLRKTNQIVELEFKSVSLDEFCQTNKIELIDFIKIDVEGHELEVLQGASRIISENRVKIIQFEFNEMNVISRVFLRDFYRILDDKYEIYRLDSDRLISLPKYTSRNEIFQYQNFLAVNRNLHSAVYEYI